MKSIHLKQFLLASLVIQVFSISCSDQLEIDLPEHPSIGVINSILSTDVPVSVTLTCSRPYPSNADTSSAISNAEVKIYKDGVYMEDLTFQRYHVGNKVYRDYLSHDNLVPEIGHQYNVKVIAQGFPEMAAETTIPEPVPIISVDTLTDQIQFGSQSTEAWEFNIRFQDPPAKGNYYRLLIDRAAYNEDLGVGPMGLIHVRVGFISNDLNLVYFERARDSFYFLNMDNDIEDALKPDVFLSDETFNGQEYLLKLYVPKYLFLDIAFPPVPGTKFDMRKLYFKLYSVNEEFYSYASSYFAQRYKVNDIFSEPIQVRSNIKNGSGIFTGSSVSVDSSIAVPVRYSPLLK